MRVPKIDIGGITQVRGVSNPYQTASAATPDAFGAGIGRATEQGGALIQQASNTLMNTAI